MELPIQEIHEGGAQIRVHENEYTISHYAEQLADGWGTFPPLAVVKIDGRFVVADGHHRLKSAIRAGLSTVPVEIIGHSMEEALEHAIRANNQNGLALTLADRQNMRRRAILELPNRSARYLAKLCGCAVPTILRDMEYLEADGLYKRQEKVRGRDGKVQSAKKKKSGVTNVTPECAVEMISCTQCGFKAPLEMLDAADSTWEKRDFNPQTMKYEAYFCGLDCLAKWESQNAPETPQNAPETPASPLGGSFSKEGPNAPQEAKNWGLRRYSLDIEVVEGTDDAEIIDLITAAFQFFSRARINNINNINLKNNINNININADSSVKTEFSWELNDGSEYYLPQEKYEQYKRCFPGIDLDAELLKCIAWGISNPKNRKTRSGILKHINNWLGNAQNSARPARVNQNAKSPYQAAHVTFEDIPY